MREKLKNDFECEDTNSSRSMQGKRALATYETCKHDLENELGLIFEAYTDALDFTSNALRAFPVNKRSRGLEANIMQSSFATCLETKIPDKSFFGKYGRLVLRTDGYVILFKKLDSKGYPMNIKTMTVQSILNQFQQLDLFSGTDYVEDPILYFGYQRSRFGDYINPQLIYIDEGEIRFSIGQNEIAMNVTETILINENIAKASGPKLKENLRIRKTN